jgi:3alpha(or 20beta)-hydroxysteroid dehydrogenase
MTEMAGKVAIVTGAAKGMGQAAAKALAKEGVSVVLTDIDPAGAATAQEIGGDAIFLKHDVGQPEDWARVVQAAQDTFGRLDYLVNNAGIIAVEPLETMSLESYERVIRVNQTGVFLGMNAVVDSMRRIGGGAIVNTSSVSGIRAFAGVLAYAASKWAVRGMTHNAAIELAELGIRVNCVLPGVIDTPMFQANPPEVNTGMIAALPIKRPGSPAEVADAIVFLLSDKASYINGVDLSVDAGMAVQ